MTLPVTGVEVGPRPFIRPVVIQCRLVVWLCAGVLTPLRYQFSPQTHHELTFGLRPCACVLIPGPLRLPSKPYLKLKFLPFVLSHLPSSLIFLPISSSFIITTTAAPATAALYIAIWLTPTASNLTKNVGSLSWYYCGNWVLT